MGNHVIYVEADRGGLMRPLIVISFTIMFVATILAGFSVMAEDRRNDNTLKELDEKIQRLEKRIEENLYSVSKVAVMTIENVRQYANYLSYGIALAGLLIAAGGAIGFRLGFREITRIRSLHEDLDKKQKDLDKKHKELDKKHKELDKQHKELDKQREKIENDLFTTTYVARSILKIIHSDAEKNKARKNAYANESVIELEDAMNAGYKNAVLLNWMGYALKRCKKFQKALDAAQSAVKLAEEEENKYQKGRGLYNSACYLALLNQPKEAMDKLEDAVKWNPTWKIFAKTEPDLDTLSNDRELGPRFKELTKES